MNLDHGHLAADYEPRDMELIDQNERLIEAMELIAQDTKKFLFYNKGTGEWGWCNRGEENDTHNGFPTRLDALKDAVEPYMEETL